MFKCVLTSLLEIKSFVSLKIESLLFWTRVHFKKGEGAKGGGVSVRFRIFWMGLGEKG